MDKIDTYNTSPGFSRVNTNCDHMDADARADCDITALLNDLGLDMDETIRVSDEPDADVIMGSDEIDDAFLNELFMNGGDESHTADDNVIISSNGAIESNGISETIAGEAHGGLSIHREHPDVSGNRSLLDGGNVPTVKSSHAPTHASPHSRAGDKPLKTSFPEEPIGAIDPLLMPGDMMMLIYAEVKRKKIAGHHLDSMNSFNQVGIKQIVTKVFTIEGRMKNLRSKTEDDQQIAEISFMVEFTDINLSRPSVNKPKTGTPEMLTPAMARERNITYSCQMHVTAEITATAYYKSGKTEVRRESIKNHHIAAIPCMVGSELCMTYGLPREALKQLLEDPDDPTGYTIVDGGEWGIDGLENIAHNSFHVHKNMHLNEIARGTFLSKPGDAFENSYQIIMRYLQNGAITIEITTNKFDKFEIPYYLIFRAMGMNRDRDIVDNIVYGVANQDPTTKRLMEILERSFETEDPKFEKVRKSTDPVEIVQHIAEKIIANAEANVSAAKKDDNITKYLNTNILNIIDKYVFPHIGSGFEDRAKKLRFLGHLINKLLCVNLGIQEPTDRDSYKKKRIFAAGTSLAKSFKTNFNFTVVQEVRRALMKNFKDTPFVGVPLAHTVITAIHGDDLDRMLTTAITSGNKEITVKRNIVTNRVSSQIIYRKNDANMIGTLNSTNTPNSSASKQNERADVMRRVHSSYAGFICISQSVDTGEKVGSTKQIACSASITGASDSFVLKRILREDPDVLSLEQCSPSRISAEKLAKIFVNGDWIGCAAQSHLLVRKYRIMRRYDNITNVHRMTTISWDPSIREVEFWTDVGRMVRPLVIVYNNMGEYIENWRYGDKTTKFVQWIKLTRAHTIGLRNGTVTMEDLRRERVIEYISAGEQENTYIAPSIEILREDRGDLRKMYTHCDIPQAILGLIMLMAPLIGHSSCVRNTYFTNHRKQSAGWHVTSHPFRMDKNVTFQHYGEYPVISVLGDAFTRPNGHNCIVALALYGGENQEDSLLVNQSSVDCGMFNASFYNYERTEIEKDEVLGNPGEMSRTMDLKRGAVYEYIKNGIIAPGTLTKKNYVLIVKTAKIAKPEDSNYQYTDRSIVYKRTEEAYIQKFSITQNAENTISVAVSWRANRPLNVGDKLSTRSGNKGIVARMVSRIDMPYSESGLTPDIIGNVHSIPTRMATNQLLETLLGQVAAIKGVHIDGTAFVRHDFDAAFKFLEARGIKYGGYQRLYNGKTGNWMTSLIFVGPTTYQRLEKFVEDEHYATAAGPSSAITHQPLDGKTNDGGLRIGEMEKDVHMVHGVQRTLYSKFTDDSDGVDIYICANCKKHAVVNAKLGIYKCKRCGDAADIAAVSSTWVADLFFKEASAMNMDLSFELEPHTYSQMQGSDK